MSQNQKNHEPFPEPTMAQWVQNAEQSLNTLMSSTYENIPLKPLYTRADVKHTVASLPGTDDYRRGVNALGYWSQPWKIAQRIRTDDIDRFKVQLHSAFQNGQNAISFIPSSLLLKDLPQLLVHYYQQHPFAVNGGINQYELFEILLKMENPDKITGFIGMDPISLYIKDPSLKLDKCYERLSRTLEKTMSSIPLLKTILINTTPYHNGGANAVQELAIALASGVEHIEKLKMYQFHIDDYYQKIIFHFSIGQSFFMEIAKLRAFRVLWGKVLFAYGIQPDEDFITISAETSSYTKTVHDPYINLIRSGNEAFAAVLGGIQYLHISPYNELEGEGTDFSARIARNMHHILKEEVRLNSIIDPGGGSWYIESITNNLIDKSWSLFLQIDDQGGIIKTIQSNWLQNLIDEVRLKKEQDVIDGKKIIVGTNKYLDPKVPSLNVTKDPSSKIQTRTIIPIVEGRLTERFETEKKSGENLPDQGDTE
ncbi:methylmalonyl-CoA mutase family protein [Niallia sp. XMNu-256]|uniref:methylmalonyl-CoA mutase family protein n=1 Tax=Niallia sp. XMNu-256 TaxID=3082444 RepID=UPI0030CE4707